MPPSPPDTIRTFTGLLVRPLRLRPDDIVLTDIAHALSNLCRFTGHTREFYSVAQHSVLVSRLCAPADALYGLLHDASEAYLCDLSRPVKYHDAFARYRTLEAGLQARILAAFDLAPTVPASVKRADDLALHAELRDLMNGADPRHAAQAQAVPAITPAAPKVAFAQFWARFHELTSGSAA